MTGLTPHSPPFGKTIIFVKIMSKYCFRCKKWCGYCIHKAVFLRMFFESGHFFYFAALKRLRPGCRVWGICLAIVVSVKDLMWKSAGSAISGMVGTASGLHRVREYKPRKCNLIPDCLCKWCRSKLTTSLHPPLFPPPPPLRPPLPSLTERIWWVSTRSHIG